MVTVAEYIYRQVVWITRLIMWITLCLMWITLMRCESVALCDSVAG